MIRTKNGFRKPLKVRRYFFEVTSNLMLAMYDNIMFILDRISSIVFISIYKLAKNNQKEISGFNVLVCRNKYYNEVDVIESNEKIFLDDTLSEYFNGSEKYTVHYYDDDQPLIGFGVKFYLKVKKINPKCIVLSSHDSNAYYHPMPWVIGTLKNHNIKVVALWWDTCSSGFLQSVRKISEAVSLNVVLDNPILTFQTEKNQSKLLRNFVSMVCPYNIKPQNKQRDIDVVFLGQISSYRDRRVEYLNQLRNTDINVFLSTKDKKEQYTHEEYYEFLFRGKIGLNFSMSVDRPQLKGRVFETLLAGCLLLDERNAQTSYYFIEDVDYVAFSTTQEMIDKIHYYLNNPSERHKITKSGREKAVELTRSKLFWDSVLSKDDL